MTKQFDMISLGAIYLDINCLDFPFTTGLNTETETIGSSYTHSPGGSAVISAKVAASLGLQPAFIGKIGTDKTGRLLSELLAECGIVPALIHDKTVQTNLGLNFVNSSGKTIMAVAGNANQNLTPEAVLLKLEEYLPQTRYLYLGGYFKLIDLQPHYEKIINLAHHHQAKVILDHGRISNQVTLEQIRAVKKLVAKVDYYFPSKDEFMAVWSADNLTDKSTDSSTNSSDKLETILLSVRSQTSALIAVKDSSRGALGIDTNGEITKIPAMSVSPINTVGAGDSFNAGFLYATIQGKSFSDCLKYANGTAASYISNHALPTRKSIEAMLQ
jgi:sugar/nucleoside kinase (ribokinase family)